MTEEKERKLVGITSPPYGLGEGIGHSGQPTQVVKDLGLVNKIRYGSSEGNIGNIENIETSDEETFDITQFNTCDEPLYWTGCYSSDKTFKKFIHPDTFAHPAKASMLLMDRIFKHLKKLGLLKRGDIVCDFLSGTSRTGIMASLHGFDFVGVELEPHFIKMSEQNKEVLEKQTGRKVNWQIIQGDARKLTELLKEKNLVGITSPPFSNSENYREENAEKNFRLLKEAEILAVKKGRKYSLTPDEKIWKKVKGYPSNPSNIGNLPDKKLIGITSPPYEETEPVNYQKENAGPIGINSRIKEKRKVINIPIPTKKTLVGITSPPFQDVIFAQDKDFYRKSRIDNKRNPNAKHFQLEAHYSSNPSNIGNLKDKKLIGITSPPYEETEPVNYQKENAGPIGINSRIKEKRKVINIPIPTKKTLVGITSPPFLEANEGGGINKEGYRGKHINEMGKNQPDKVGERCGYQSEKFSSQNISNLPDKNLVGITSPPFEEMATGNVGGGIDWNKAHPNSKQEIINKSIRSLAHRYSSNPSNIGNLSDKNLVGITSPPFENQTANVDRPSKQEDGKWNKMVSERKLYGHYSDSQENLGNQQGESYLSAMLQVYQQASQLMPIIVTITKNPTRKGKLRRLDIDTAKLLMMCGYKIIDYHRALLFTEEKQKTLVGTENKVLRGRLSFFKRLSIQKGNKAAMWEDVIIAVKE